MKPKLEDSGVKETALTTTAHRQTLTENEFIKVQLVCF